MRNRSLWAVIAALALAAAACTCSRSFNFPPNSTPVPDPKATIDVPEPTAGPSPTPLPTTTGEERSEDAAIYEALLSTPRPNMDRIDLAIQLKGVQPSDIPEPPTEPVKIYQEGDEETFWIHLQDNQQYIQVDFTVAYVSEHAYFFAPTGAGLVNASGSPARSQDWEAAGTTFDASYEKVREIYGEEPSPGVDGDARLFVIVAEDLGGPGGYYSPSDRLPPVINEHSNQHEMFFVLSNTGINSDYFNATLAHEFQHMVHDASDSGEEGWMDEGLAEVAQLIAGVPDYTWISYYTGEPDQPLWYWPSTSGDYGHSLLVMDYIYERFGDQFIHDLVANPSEGMQAIDETLAASGQSTTFDAVWAEFATALVFNDTSAGDGRYGFELPVDSPYTEESLGSGSSTSATVSQYGLDIYPLDAGEPLTLNFSGDALTTYIPTQPHSGSHMWWSTRTDSMYSTLTHEIDLTSVDTATLKFWTWYNTEEGWDYAYVQASTDGGLTWTPLEATTSTDEDPNNANYGHGITGRSGSDRSSEWIEETVDLSAYAGQTIQLRFAMFNDEALHEDNIAIDDISIPEINWSDDGESGSEGWVGGGWMLITNRAPQHWMVRVAMRGSDGEITVQDVEVVDGVGTLNIDTSQASEAYILVGGMTRFSNSTPSYTLTLNGTN